MRIVALALLAATMVAAPVDAATERQAAHRVVGTGTPASCTSAAVVKAVAAGGTITFDCGPDPVVIVMKQTAKVVNTNPVTVIDGGGKVTLSGDGKRRILYQNTCDPAQVWTTDHCQAQKDPLLVDQGPHLQPRQLDGGDLRGRRGRRGLRARRPAPGAGLGLRPQPVRPHRPRPRRRGDPGPQRHLGGQGQGQHLHPGQVLQRLRAQQHRRLVEDPRQRVPEEQGGRQRAPTRPEPGTPGGGSGGAIYLDGNFFTLRLDRVLMEDNKAREGGGAIFFVSNDRTGTMTLSDSTLRRNPSLGFETYPGIFFLGAKASFVDGTSVS